MAIQKEIWMRHIVEPFYADNSFLSHAYNADEYVNGGKVVHIPNAGSASNVEMNRSEYPAKVKLREDSDLTFKLDEFTTDPIRIPNAETKELSYDKRESVIRLDKQKLYEHAAKSILRSWMPHADKTIETTGDEVDAYTKSATGKRKALVEADVLKLMTRFNAADLPQEGRYLLLDAHMYSQLLASLTNNQQNAFAACADVKRGVVGKLHSFNVMLRSTVGLYSADKTPKDITSASETDLAASLAWHESCVCRALGDQEMFSSEDDPTYYGDIYSILVRAGGRRMRADGEGVIAIVQGTVA